MPKRWRVFIRTPSRSDGPLRIWCDMEQADILTLATDSQARRKGHARKLLRSVQEYLENKSIRTLFLDVAENNNAAISLYKACGFQPIGRRPAYYRTLRGRIAAITFSKSL